MEENTEDCMAFASMADTSAIDAYLDGWITQEQLLTMLLNEPWRLSKENGDMLMNDNSTLEKIIHQHDVSRCLRSH